MNVQLFFFNIHDFPNDDDFIELGNASSLLHLATDASKVLSYISIDDRRRALASQLMLQKFVASPVTRKNTLGSDIKPHCSSPNLCFNISHDSDMVVLAVMKYVSIGVDIMKIQKTSSRVSIEQMFTNLIDIMTEREWKYINGVCPSDEYMRLTRFYHIWTAKEAYVKCLGTGLYVEPQHLEVEILERDESIVHVCVVHNDPAYKESSKSCFVTRVYKNMFPGYVLSVCAGQLDKCDSSWVSLMDSCSNDVEWDDSLEINITAVSFVDLVA